MVDEEIIKEVILNRKIVTFTYTKKTTGEIVTHTGGIYELGNNKQLNRVIWLWDTTTNDHIRQFLVENIGDFQVLDTTFEPNPAFGLKIDGVPVEPLQ